MPGSQAGPIISGSPGDWEAFLRRGLRRAHPANATLLHAGDKPGYIYYIESGEVLVSSYASPEFASRLFILREKSILGLTSMFSPHDSLGTWLTLKPTILYAFDKKTLYEKAPPEVLLHMLEQFGAMSSSMARRFAYGHLKRLEVGLARLLMHLLDSCAPVDDQPDRGMAVAPYISQKIVSELLGMHPVTLSRALRRLRDLGVLGQFTKKKLEVFDLDALAKYANGQLTFGDCR